MSSTPGEGVTLHAPFTDPEGGSTSYAYDTLNRLQSLAPPAAISGGSFGFSYDANTRTLRTEGCGTHVLAPLLQGRRP